MIKTFNMCFSFDTGESPRGWESKALKTHSKKLRPTVSLPRKNVDPFEKYFLGMSYF